MKKFVLSDASVNSHGFRLDMEKIKLDRFKANPVMLYNHWDLVGKWDQIELKDGRLTAVPVFMDDENETLAIQTKKRVDNGFLKGASLGIQILEVHESAGEPPVVIAEVMEASIVDVPSNANALALYDKAGKRLEGDAYRLALDKITRKEINIKNHNMELSQNTKQMLGLSGKAGWPEIESAIQNLSAERDQLKQQLQTMKQKQVNELLDAAIADGRLKADLRDQYARLADQDFDLFTQTLKSLPKTAKLPPAQRQPKDDARLSGRENWSFDDWRKKDPAGLLSIKKTDPELYQKIVNL